MKSVFFKMVLLFFVLLIGKACTQKNIKKDPINHNTSAVLIVKRGAFHYDQFILKDTLLTFHPNHEIKISDLTPYDKKSEKVIAASAKNDFIQSIIDRGFFDLKEYYPCMNSCSSRLTITLTVGNKTKKVIAEDYIRDCPQLLQDIEKEIIKLHGKDLIRIHLPG